MTVFSITHDPIDARAIAAACRTDASGALASFEGTVRNHNAGESVWQLEYSCYEPLALTEGTRILDEARARFEIHDAACTHRVGVLAVGDAAVFVCVSAAHRGPAFAACQFIIDAVKARVPIWKKEFRRDGAAGWVDPTANAGAAP